MPLAEREVPTAEKKFGMPSASAKLRRVLKGDLDNILLKALRKEPERRYASVEQLAEDIRRHLDGLPVTATPDCLSYRISKFVRRHRTGVAASLVILCVIAGGVTATFVEARIAKKQAQIARAERTKSERRFNDVRALANSMIFDIHDSIQDLPGATKARKLLINGALQYLDSLARESGGDPSLQRELAAAYARVGDLQVYNGLPDDTLASTASYQKGLAIREAVHAADPQNVDDAVALADSSRQVAEALMDGGQPAVALPYSNRAIEITEQLAKTQPSNPKVLRELAHDYANQGNVLAGDFNWSNLGDNVAALAVRRKQLEVSTRVAGLLPDLPAEKRRMGDAMIMLGDQLLQGGERRAARMQYAQARQVLQSLLGRIQSAQLLNDSDALYQRLANAALQNGDLAEAEAYGRRALDTSQKLATADAQNIWAQVMLAEDISRLAEVLARSGRRKQSVRFIQKALGTINAVARLNPQNTDVLGTQANIDLAAAHIYREPPQHSQALIYCRDAIGIYSRVQAKQPGNVGIHLFLAAAYNSLGKIQAQQRDFLGANDAYHKALEFINAEADSTHYSVDALYMMATSYAGLGDLEFMQARNKINFPEQQKEHRGKARQWYSQSARVWALVTEPGVTSPNGFDCTPITVVRKQLEQASVDLESWAGRNTPIASAIAK